MLKLTVLFAAVVVLSPACNAGDVVMLTDSDFDSRLANENLALVKFFAPWCGHCKKLAPEFEKAATALKNSDPPVMLAEVDCTDAGKEMCSRHGVSGYPTLKAFKLGEKAFDYEGPRDSDGIVKYMRKKAGPTSKLLASIEDAEKFLSNSEHGVVGFFSSADSDLSKQFSKLADALSESHRFAYTSNSDILEKYGHKDVIVIYQPLRLQTKMEPSYKVFDGDSKNLNKLKDWVNDNLHGLAGHRTPSNSGQFKNPLVVVYYDVDYTMNPKGTNYWRNRVIKVAKKFAEAGRKITFAISSASDFSHELSEYAMDFNSAKGNPVVAARDSSDQKYAMKADFSVESLEQFANELLDGKLKPYLKSEPIPDSNDEPVKVVVAESFNDIVNDDTKDVLIEFYAPWCGHCKSLAPKYDELAKKLEKEDSIVIAKMDATANDVPKPYEVQGFPTIYFAPKGSKQAPKKYQGAREVKDFIEYIAREAATPLQGYDRSGKKVKSKKDKTDL
jgi:protein disulfide isomerase family A protein 3